MPHVVIGGPASIEKLFQDFEPLDIHEGKSIMKIRDMFLNTRKAKALLECIVVENRISYTFYLIVSKKDEQLTVHLDPLTDPEKVKGVKRLVAIVAERLKSQDPQCTYVRHNLTGFLRLE